MSSTATQAFTEDQLQADAHSAVQVAAEAGTNAPSLVAEWVRRANGAAVQAVAEGGQGPARKAARRGLGVLKSRGVAVPRAPKVAAVGQPAGHEATGAVRLAWLLPPDNSGSVGLVLARRTPSGRYQSAFCFFRSGMQLLRVEGGEISHSKLKENMQRALSGAGYGPVEVPYQWAQFRIAERRKWHGERSLPEPMGMMAAEALLEGAPAEAPPHPFDEEGLALGEEDAVKLAKDSAELHQWPEFRGWLPSQAALQDLLNRVGSRLTQQTAADPAAVGPALKEEVIAATDRYFTPERRQGLLRNMKDAALSVLSRGGEHDALRVAAVMTVIDEAGLITNPPSEVGFLTAFFDKGVAMTAAQQGGRLRVPIPRQPAEEGSPQAGAEAPPAGEEGSAGSEGEEADGSPGEPQGAAPSEEGAAPPAEAAPSEERSDAP